MTPDTIDNPVSLFLVVFSLPLGCIIVALLDVVRDSRRRTR